MTAFSGIGNGPLTERLIRLAREELVSFHMPGHKNGRLYRGNEQSDTLLPSFLPQLDVTEIPGSDHLHNPTGVIGEAQKRAAAVFGSESAYFLVNGSTGGIYAMMTAAADPGDEILINRNAHQSVYNACLLGGITPRYIQTELDPHLGVPLSPTPEQVSQALTRWPGVKGVVITRPTYHGFVTDLAEIARRIHQQNKVLLVDEAHGAHLILSEKLPPSAMACGADASVQSTHKTLSAFTQAAMLHVQGTRMDRDRLEWMLRLYQSSSPSYLLMSSLDAAVSLALNPGPLWMERLLDQLQELRKRVSAISGLLFTGSHGYRPDHQEVDPTRLWMDLHQSGWNGYEVDTALRQRWGIQVEMADLRGALALVSIGNTEKDLDRLGEALYGLSEEKGDRNRELTASAGFYPPPRELPLVRHSLREASLAHQEWVPLNEAEGKISARSVIPYPPGVPLVVPGEEVSRELVRYVERLHLAGIEILGIQKEETIKLKVMVM